MAGTIGRIKNGLLELLYPSVCPVCGKILPAVPDDKYSSVRSVGISAWENPYICSNCRGKLSFPEEPRCLKCSRPVQSDTMMYCRDCGSKKRFFDSGTAAMIHDGEVRQIIYDLKYSNRKDNARMLAAEAAVRCAERVLRWNPEVIIPVPLHKKRLQKRGYNQAEVLARRFAGELAEYKGCEKIPVDPDYLIRIKNTVALKELGSGQRGFNIRGAFAVNENAADKKYGSVLIIDDIYTSGATVSECARVLREHGVSKIYFLTFSIG